MMHSAPQGSRLASGAFFWWRAVIAHCRQVRPGGSPIPPVPRPPVRSWPRRRTSGVPTATEAHLPTVAHPRPANAFSDVGAVPHPRSQNAPMGSAAAVLQQRRFFFLKSILNMHFLQSGGAAHLAGAKQFRPPPGPQELAGGPREKRRQSVTACKPCFRHATAHAESKPSSSVSRTSTLERARPSTGDAARNEAAAHRIKRAAGRG
jgi:hypothetical protein